MKLQSIPRFDWIRIKFIKCVPSSAHYILGMQIIKLLFVSKGNILIDSQIV